MTQGIPRRGFHLSLHLQLREVRNERGEERYIREKFRLKALAQKYNSEIR
jgi:hypothetical protein